MNATVKPEVIVLEPLKKVNKKAPQKIRVCGYARVSHESELSSYDTQVKYYTDYINAHPDWHFAGVYADPVISGTQAENRPQFMQMMKDAEEGKLDLILVKSISRFARNTLDCLKYVRHLQNLGVNIIFEQNHLDTRNNFSEMLLTVLSAFAQSESLSISENTKWGIRKRFEEGVARWCKIYGYKKVEGEGEYIVVPEEAKVVQFIFKLYERGASIDNILKQLMDKGIKSPTGNDKWVRSQVHIILKNEKYVGDLMLQKWCCTDHLTHKSVRNTGEEVRSFYVKNHHIAIVDRKTYDRVQYILGMKKMCNGDTKNQYPFGDKLLCPICGKPLHAQTILIQSKHSRGWCCQEGCGNFIIRGYCIEPMLVKAYNELDIESIRSKLEKRPKSAGLALKLKEEIPTVDKVDYFWLDDMVDHIELGQHTLTSKKVKEMGKKGEPIVDDRTMTIYWRYGIKRTISSGVEKDCDNPRYVAKLWKDYLVRSGRSVDADTADEK